MMKQICLVSLAVLLPCLCSAAVIDLRHLGNAVDTVLRFVKGKEKGDTTETISTKWSPPAFCNGLSCPQYRVLENKTYELREYVATNWVSTTSIDIDYDKANHDDFMRLFAYISGNNMEKQKIDMTAPVLNRIIPGQGAACADNFTMSFFIAPAEGRAPKPSDSKVFLSRFPSLRVYVRSFPEFASKQKWLKEASALAKELDGKANYVKEYYYTAGYDSPFQLTNRHNEVWFIAK